MILHKSKISILIIGIIILAIFGLIIFNIYLDQNGVPLLFSFLEPKPGKCHILEEKYCKKMVLIPDPWEKDKKLAAFKVPPGTLLFSPVTGTYSNTATFFFENESEKYPGVTVTEFGEGDNGNKKPIAVYAMVYFIKGGKGLEPRNIQKGEIISKISEKTITYLGNYNLIFGYYQYNEKNNSIGKFSEIINKTKEYFEQINIK